MEPNSAHNALAGQYADLLGGDSDPALLRLVTDLDAMHTTAEPSAATRGAIATALRARANGIATHAPAATRRHVTVGGWRSTMRWAARRPLVAAASLVLALVLLAGAAYAVEPVLMQAFNMEPGTQQLVELNLAQDVHIVRQVDGFTVTLEKAYADSNRVILGYTTSTPPGHGYEVGLLNAVLTSSDGLTFPAMGGFATGTQSNAEGHVVWFDAGQITGTPAELQLHLTAQGLGGDVNAGSPTVHDYQVLGQLDFDFTVAFHPGHIAASNETVTVGGQAMTLERIVVTPSEVRVYLRLHGEDASLLFATLTVDGWSSAPGQGDHGPQTMQATANGHVILTYDDSIYDKHGAGTLVVQYPNSEQAPSGGPWTFHFTLP